MKNKFAKEIITEYVFANYNIKAVYPFIKENIDDATEKKLYAESLLTKALQRAVIVLGENELDN